MRQIDNEVILNKYDALNFLKHRICNFIDLKFAPGIVYQ